MVFVVFIAMRVTYNLSNGTLLNDVLVRYFEAQYFAHCADG